MAATAILENGKIAIPLQPIIMKFDMVTRIGTPYAQEHLEWQF